MKTFRLLATLMALVCAFALSGQIQLIIGLLLMVSIGVLHGANDLKLLQQVVGTKDFTQNWSVRFIYTAFLLNILGILILYPIFALFFFLIISAYHFGEQHLSEKIASQSFWVYIAYFCYGSTLLTLLLLFNMNEIQNNVFKDLTFHLRIELLSSVGLVCGALSLILLGVFSIGKKDAKLFFGELLNLVFLGFVFYEVSLLWAFTIYFVFWHSIPALRDQLLELYGKVDGTSFLMYCKTSWLNWLVIVLSFGLFWYLSSFQYTDYAAILIPFITAVTLPHIIVSHLLQRTIKKSDNIETWSPIKLKQGIDFR